MQQLLLAILLHQKLQLLTQTPQNRRLLQRLPLLLCRLLARWNRHAIFLRKAQHVIAGGRGIEQITRKHRIHRHIHERRTQPLCRCIQRLHIMRMLLNVLVGKKGRRKFGKALFLCRQHSQPLRLRHRNPINRALQNGGEKIGLPSFAQTGKERVGVRFLAGNHSKFLWLLLCLFRHGHGVRVKPKTLRHAEHFKTCEQPHSRRAVRQGGHIMRHITIHRRLTAHRAERPAQKGHVPILLELRPHTRLYVDRF